MKYVPDFLTAGGAAALLYGVHSIYAPAAWILGGLGVLALGGTLARSERR